MADRLVTFTVECELVYDDEWKDFSPLALVVDTIKTQILEGNFEITNVVDELLKEE